MKSRTTEHDNDRSGESFYPRHANLSPAEAERLAHPLYVVEALPTDGDAEARLGRLLSDRYQTGVRVRRFLAPGVSLEDEAP